MSYVPDLNAYGMLSDLGDRITKSFQQAQQKQLLSSLGQDLMGGDYQSAAAKALQAGDMATGLKLMELGQQKQNAAALPGLLQGPSFGQPQQANAAPAPTGDGSGGDYFGKLAQIESKGNPNAVSPTGAQGLFQFIPSTWKQYGGGADVRDPQAQFVAVQKFTADNRNALTQALGREPTAGELYLAHQQGAGGAIKLLANPGATPAELGLGRNVAVNGGNPNAPAGQFVQKWTSKFDGVGSPLGFGARDQATAPASVAYAKPPAAPAASEDDGEEDKPAAGAQLAQGAVPAVPTPAKPAKSDDSENTAKIAALRDYQTKLTTALATVSGDGPKAAITARLQQVKDQLTELKPDKEKFQIIQTEDGYRAINKSDPSQFQDIKTGKPKNQVEFESRKVIADDLGLTGQERKMFLVNGSLSEKQNKDISEGNRQREAEGARLGLKGDDLQQYVLNGKVQSAAEKQTEGQANAALYARRMAESDKILNDPRLTEAMMSRKNIALGAVPSFGNSMVPKEYQLADQAKRDFLNATLRRESGAAISQSEFDNANKQYFPQPGDGPDVIAQKAKNRRTSIEGIANAAAPSFREEFFGTKKPGLGVGLRDGGQAEKPATPPVGGGMTKSGVKWSIE